MIVAWFLAAILGTAGLALFAKSKSLFGAKAYCLKFGAVSLLLLAVVTVVATAIKIVPPGHVAVVTFFGSVQQRVFDEGFHVVNPLYRFKEYLIRRTMFDFQGTSDASGQAGEEIVAVSSDSTPLTMDIGFPIRLNGPLAWKIFQRIGDQSVVANQLIVPGARAAVRDAVAGFTSRDVATMSRSKLASGIETRFRQLVERDLVAAGFAESEASTAFTIQPVQLRKILPPQKVLNAVSEKIAAEEDLERQKTLTQIA